MTPHACSKKFSSIRFCKIQDCNAYSCLWANGVFMIQYQLNYVPTKWELTLCEGCMGLALKQNKKRKKLPVFCFAGKRKLLYLYLRCDYMGKIKKKLC
jgi:hypothetical protein